jgi:hypothetical protein
MAINLSYPKPKKVYSKFVSLGVADSSTEKCVLPKGAIIVDVNCTQTVAATTNASTWLLGWAADTDGVLNAFASATTSVGSVKPGTKMGSGWFTQLTADRSIISTCTPGASDTTSVVVVEIRYIVTPGQGETHLT